MTERREPQRAASVAAARAHVALREDGDADDGHRDHSETEQHRGALGRGQ
jgi:hypothetical protein